MLDLKQKRFGKLLVIERAENIPQPSIPSGVTAWLCACDCGTMKVIRGAHLKHGVSTTCGCSQRAHARGLCLSNRKYVDGAARVMAEYQLGAKTRGLAFTLSLGDLVRLTSSDCYYCGAPPSRLIRKTRFNGIDRLQNADGYIITNVVPCWSGCNMAKRGDTAFAFISRCRRIANRHA